MDRRNFKSIAIDIAEGMVVVNPIFLKTFKNEDIVSMYKAAERRLTEIRAEPFPYGQADPIRRRNLRIQRLHSSMVILRNLAREKKILLV
ncbi:MAG TPA: hypothetical protein VK445_09200 [Dissulfurispiraceae bacterium]|nr:hypothetical protein [Dissulfurispiraceae bacterium]